jgi:hypothetical protein
MGPGCLLPGGGSKPRTSANWLALLVSRRTAPAPFFQVSNLDESATCPVPLQLLHLPLPLHWRQSNCPVPLHEGQGVGMKPLPAQVPHAVPSAERPDPPQTGHRVCTVPTPLQFVHVLWPRPPQEEQLPVPLQTGQSMNSPL